METGVRSRTPRGSRWWAPWALIGTTIVITLPVLAADTGLGEALAACGSIENDGRRLDCFDALLEQATAGRPTTSPSSSSDSSRAGGGSREVTVEEEEADFGREHVVGDRPSQIARVVRSVEKNALGRLVITLDDGQIWQQSDGARLHLQPGDRILLHRGALSAFYLSTSESGRRYRFERVP